MVKKRPKHLDLRKIKLPVPGVVSILHRVSGVILFLSLPVLLYTLEVSLASPEGFDSLKRLFGHPLSKLVLIGALWAFLHHLLAGVRYLAIDLHYGVDLAPARTSAKAVLGLSIALTLILGAALW